MSVVYALHLIVSILMCTTILVWSVSRIVMRRFDPREDLPLGLCNLTAFIAPAQIFAQSPLLAAWSVCIGGPGGLASLVAPDLEVHHDRATRLKFWLIHCGLVLDALLCALLFAPTGGSALLLRLIGALAALVPIVALANHWLGANYFFLRSKPSTASLLDRFGPWPGYVAAMFAIAALAIAASFAAWSAGWGLL
jgi:hypothetical integral membrane protein (TIGR02206 family)